MEDNKQLIKQRLLALISDYWTISQPELKNSSPELHQTLIKEDLHNLLINSNFDQLIRDDYQTYNEVLHQFYANNHYDQFLYQQMEQLAKQLDQEAVFSEFFDVADRREIDFQTNYDLARKITTLINQAQQNQAPAWKALLDVFLIIEDNPILSEQFKKEQWQCLFGAAQNELLKVAANEIAKQKLAQYSPPQNKR